MPVTHPPLHKNMLSMHMHIYISVLNTLIIKFTFIILVIRDTLRRKRHLLTIIVL